jgi:glycosyltransferase involved in cell wall biosynthesis
MDKKKMLITGYYVGDYPRNKNLIASLKEVFLVEEENYRDKRVFSFLKNIRKKTKGKDYIFLPYSSYKFIFLVLSLKLFTNKTIIYDAFISFYDTFVTDRKRFKAFSISGIIAYLLDYLVLKVADILVFDTKEHQEYFVEKYNINKNKKKLLIWPVSLNLKEIDNFLSNVDNNSDNNYDNNNLFSKDKFNILFYGTYIPLQGIEYIVKAAKILKDQKDISFALLGDGQEKDNIEKIIKKDNIDNIELINSVTYDKLFSYIKTADLCLGIFGDTDKAKRVIANKVLECLSAKKIVITGRNNALERYFEGNNDIVYCELANEKDLAEKILEIYKDYEQYKKLGYNGREKIEISFSTKALREKIRNNIV